MQFRNRNFLSDVSSVFVVKVLVFIASFVSSIYLARILGPEEKGELTLVSTIYGTVVQFGCLGIHSANTYYISRDKRKAKLCEGNIIILTFLVFILCTVLLPLFWVNETIINLNNYNLVIAFLLAPMAVFLMLQGNFFVALGEIKRYNLMELHNNSLYVLAVIVLSIWMDVNVELVVSCMLMFMIIINVYSLKFFLTKVEKNVKISFQYFMNVLPYGIKSYIACLANYLVLRADVFMISHYQNSYEVGIYSLATSFIDMSFMVSSSISLVLFPQLSSVNNVEKKHKLIKRVFAFSSIIQIIMYVIMWFLAEFAINLLYGTEYSQSASILRILIPGAYFWASSSIYFNFFASENSLIVTILIPFITLLFNVVGNLYFIPYYGGVGAAYTSLFSYTICFVGIYLSYLLYIGRRKRDAGV